jgi:hypothetical protein
VPAGFTFDHYPPLPAADYAPARVAVRLLEDLKRATRDVIVAYDCGHDEAELSSWAALDSAWNALQRARGRST